MIKLPELTANQKDIQMINTYKGYNHNEVISDNEMYDMQNLGSENYPAISPRMKRGIHVYHNSTLRGLYGKTKLTMIIGNSVLYNGEETGLTVSTQSNMLPKQIISIGAYVCIWPDKVYFNSTKYEDQGSMERIWKATENVTIESASIQPIDNPSVQICRNDGTDYDLTQVAVSATAPNNPDDGDFWIDESGSTDVLRQYNATKEEWVEVPTVYVKIRGNNVGKGLKEYDTINIYGLEISPFESTPDQRTAEQLAGLNGSHIVYACGNDYVIIVGLLNDSVTLNYKPLQINREVPDLDYICESNNRLWGCYYGSPMKKHKKAYRRDLVTVSPCEKDGTLITNPIYSDETPPESPTNGQLWIQEQHVGTNHEYHMMKYNGNQSKWEAITGYVSIAATGIGTDYIDGDTIVIENLDYIYRPPMRNPVLEDEMTMLNGRKKLIKVTDDYIVYEGVLYESYTESDTSEDVNLYNTKYGEDYLNEIRACKLGDFKNWNCFMGLSTDSYAISIGSPGPFTGATGLSNNPIFFKENCIIRIYGATPSAFQTVTEDYPGVQDGSSRSIVNINNTIYYKGVTNIYRYDGNPPVSISDRMGKLLYEDARAGALDGKYYICMKNNNVYTQFCYDTKLNIWNKEDELKALQYATVGNELYLIDETNNALVTVRGSAGTLEDDPEWYAVFGLSGIEYRDNRYGSTRYEIRGAQYMSRFVIRMNLAESSKAELWIEYDSDGIWIKQGEIRGNRLKSFMIPVIPRRCDHLRIKLTGKGDFRIYGISRYLEGGSDA